jgi:hypothetical protein
MAVLRSVFVWPSSGFTGRLWCDNRDDDAFAEVSRAVCDRYSEMLTTLGLEHTSSTLQVQISADLTIAESLIPWPPPASPRSIVERSLELSRPTEERSRDTSPAVRRVVAARLDAPIDVLRGLAADSDRAVREAVMTNPSSPAEVVAMLVGDQNQRVRWALLDRTAAPDRMTLPALVQRAVCDSSDAVLRAMVAERFELDPETASRLAADPDAEIRQRLAQVTADPDLLWILAADQNPKVRAGAAGNRHATLEQLLSLVGDPSPDVRVRLIGRRHPLPEPTCLILAKDRASRVRQALADADWTPTGVLESLAQGRDEEVARRARTTLNRRSYRRDSPS